MRTLRISRPLSNHKGLSVPKRFFSLALIVLASLATVPASAANVTVGFGLSAGAYAPTEVACQLSVPANANGIAVLDAAVAQNCIVSYETKTFAGFGSFVSCVDEVCGDEATGFGLTYWKYYKNGVPATSGIDNFRAAAGSSIVLSFTTWVGCLAAQDDPLC